MITHKKQPNHTQNWTRPDTKSNTETHQQNRSCKATKKTLCFFCDIFELFNAMRIKWNEYTQKSHAHTRQQQNELYEKKKKTRTKSTRSERKKIK